MINNPLKAGRTFTDADIRQAQLVMIVNETLARAAFGDAEPDRQAHRLLRRRAGQAALEDRRRRRRRHQDARPGAAGRSPSSICR